MNSLLTDPKTNRYGKEKGKQDFIFWVRKFTNFQHRLPSVSLFRLPSACMSDNSHMKQIRGKNNSGGEVGTRRDHIGST